MHQFRTPTSLPLVSPCVVALESLHHSEATSDLTNHKLLIGLRKFYT